MPPLSDTPSLLTPIPEIFTDEEGVVAHGSQLTVSPP